MASRPTRMLARPKEAAAGALAIVVLLALVTAFATQLADTQARNAAAVRARVHERAVLAGALIDGLFGTVSQNGQVNERLYGGSVIRQSVLERQLQTDTYLAVLGPSGRILAHTSGLTPELARRLDGDLGVRLVRGGAPYGLGNLVAAAPRGGVIDFAEPVPTRGFGRRILVSAFSPALLSGFLQSDLRKVPGVRGASNYVIDGAGRVLASTVPAAAPGTRFTGPVPSGAPADFSRDAGGRYYDEVKLAGSQWRIVLGSPDGPLYASVSGFGKWLPWIIFSAFAVVSVVAFFLVGKVFTASEQTRRANERLGEANRELETSNAMLAQRAAELARSNEELDQFASIASHDLQEPLRKVRTFTEQLARSEADNLSPKGQDYIRRANAAAERMQTLIEDLLRFSRVSTHAIPSSAVDLRQALSEALEDLDPALEESGARIHVGALPTIEAEPLRMRQLMQNLVSNAVKFRDPQRPAEVWIDSELAGDELRLIVRDNGIGFEPRYAARIFRVFERLHGRTDYPGTGIGLALCRKIVERHDGAISADGVPGVGATFVVSLPASRVLSLPPVDAREEAHV